MAEATIFRKNPDIVTRTIDEETILIPLYKSSEEINCIYTLNKVASTVWDLFDGKRSLGQVKEEILQRFDTTTDEVNKEMAELIKDLEKIKAIVKRR